MTGLPTGTVTFLFTDIEGSTALLQRLGDRRYAELLADHQRLLREAFARGNGQEIDTQGDAFLVAFSRARDALAAAVTAQQALTKYRRPDGVSLRVRMGLHTGEPVSATTGYVGLDVHRASRICAAGHGGQILVSQTVKDLAALDPPARVSLRDLGLHRLKDLQEPEHIFQVVHPDLRSEFPRLKSLDALPNNLPRQLTSFVGREREIAEVKALLSSTCLLTLTGAGGAGKTRLALRIAGDMLEQYPDGVWLAQLAPLSEPTLVPKSVSSALGIAEQPGITLTETVIDYLRSRASLLLLDNCEHLLEACAHLAHALLQACPNLRILATSRQALGITGELAYRVPSLSLPDLERLPSPQMLTQYEAVRLFVERAALSKPGFQITDNNAAAVAEVTHRLDGIPLAIELAAARVKALPVDVLAKRLVDRFRVLTGGSRGSLPRHQTLRATLDWSYDLLSDPERTLLCRLSVFAGGFMLEAGERICSGEGVDAGDILDLLARLVDKSLVVFDEQDRQARYRLLETVRQYSWDRLVESNEAAAVRRQHRDWYLGLAESAEPKLRGPEQGVWLERLETEHDNLRVAMEWSKSEEGGTEAWLRLAGALHWFWFMRGYASEGSVWLEGALSASRDGSAAVRARALCGAGLLAWRQGEFGRAGMLLQEGLTLFRELKDKWGIAYALHHMGHVVDAQGDYGRALALFEESVALFREVGDKWGVGWSLHCLGGNPVRNQGDYGRAAALLEESERLIREVGDVWQLPYVLEGPWDDRGKAGRLQESDSIVRGGLGHRTTGREHVQHSRLRTQLAKGALREGDNERALTLNRESLILQRELGNKAGLGLCLEGLAGVACAQGDYARAARLLAAADALREALSFQRAPSDKADHDQRVASARAALGDAAFVAASDEGRAMTLEQAVEYALGSTDQTQSRVSRRLVE